ncbi:MAG: glucose-6-phosphate isomerase, partial [Rhodoferax sp.]
MTRTRCDHTPAWSALQTSFNTGGRAFDLRTAFAADAGRFAAFSQSAPHVFADLSKNLIDSATQQLLLDLARQSGVEQHRDAMFAGERINSTEQRAVMHCLLRTPPADPAMPAQSVHRHMAETLHEVHATLDAMLAYAQAVRGDEAITDVVNIGIGGS